MKCTKFTVKSHEERSLVGYSPGARNRVRHDWTHLNNNKREPEQRATLDFDLHSSWKAHTNTHVTMSPCRTIIQHNHGLKLFTFQALKSCWTILMQTTLFSRYVGVVCVCVCVLVIRLCPTFSDAMDWSLPGSSVHGRSPGKNTGVGCHSLLQGSFPTQGSNPGLSRCRQILYHLSHQGSPMLGLHTLLIKIMLPAVTNSFLCNSSNMIEV